MKKLISILLVAMLILGMFPATALTASAEDGTWTLVTDASTLKAGDQLVFAETTNTKGDFVAGSLNGKYLNSIAATFSDNTIPTLPTSAVVFTLGGSSGKWTFSTNNKLLGSTAAKALALGSGTTTWTIAINSSDGKATIANTNSSCGKILYNRDSPRFLNYTSNVSASMLLPQLYRLETSGGSTEPEQPVCEHPNKVAIGQAVEATCTTPGKTAGEKCADCGETIKAQEEIPALGHNYVDGTCEHCGEPEPVAPEFPEIPETGNYKLITDLTEVLTGGQCVFVVEYEGNYYALGNEIADKIAPVETVVSGEYVYGSAPSWLVGSYDGGLVLFNGTKYLGHSSGANFTSAADPSKWIVQDNEDGTFLLISSADEERAVAYNYNSGNHRFGPYAVENLDNAQYALRLRIYKKVNDGAMPEFKGALSFVENGKAATVTPTYGSSYTLPAATETAPTGYTFAGWVEAALDETTVAPETIHAPSTAITVPASKTYYALYTRSETTQGGETVKEYQKASSIAVGDTVVLVYETNTKELGSISTTSTKYGIGVDYSGVPAGAMPLTVVVGSGAAYAFKTADNKYLYWSSGNSLNVNATLNANTSWNVTFDANGNATIANGKDSARKIFWNNSSPRFACYNTTAQKPVQLYVLTEVASGGSTTTNYYTTVVEASCAHGSYVSKNATTVACAYCGIEKAAPVNVNGTAYETIEAAAATGKTVILNQNVENAVVSGELKLDLNGHNATNVTATKIYAIDSSAKRTESEGKVTVTAGDGSLTTTSEVEMDYTANGVRYIALQDENGAYSFHILEMKLSAVSLRTSAAGIYYKAIVNCDEKLAGAVSQYGIALSTRNMPGADFATENEVNGWTVVQGNITSGQVFTSGSVFGIFKDGLTNNAARGAVKIYANAYIVVGGTTIMADTTTGDKATDDGFDGIAWSLKDVMVKLNETFTTLSEKNQKAVAEFYGSWSSAMDKWDDVDLSNISAAANLPA